VQLRDIIQANTMTEGNFTYEVRVVDKDNRELMVSTLEFAAVQGARGADGT
jgi:hypothetical protein